MKRIQVAPGKFVTISNALAEQAARIAASDPFTPEQMREAVAIEKRFAGTVLIGCGGRRAPTRRRGPRDGADR